MKRLLLFFIVCGLTSAAEAQQALMDLMPQIFSSYPRSSFRREYKCDKHATDSIDFDLRYDWSTTKKDVAPDFLRKLIAAFDAEAPLATESSRYIGHFATSDTLSYTLVYQGRQTQQSDLIVDHIGNRTFSAHRGFATLDIFGHSLNMKVMTTKAEPGQIGRVDASPLDSVFQELARRKAALLRDVAFTGNKGGFVFQRRQGRGWTKGQRLTLAKASQQDFDDIIALMASYFGRPQGLDIILYSSSGSLFVEAEKTVYITQYDANNATLYFLKASTNGDICIPHCWTEQDYFNNGRTY